MSIDFATFIFVIFNYFCFYVNNYIFFGIFATFNAYFLHFVIQIIIIHKIGLDFYKT